MVGDLPASAFYKEGSVDLEDEGTRKAFHRYFDLSNEQLFLASQKRRISVETTKQWKDGIRGNMALPAFHDAWAYIDKRIPHHYFEDLRDLLDEPSPEGPPPGR